MERSQWVPLACIHVLEFKRRSYAAQNFGVAEVFGVQCPVFRKEDGRRDLLLSFFPEHRAPLRLQMTPSKGVTNQSMNTRYLQDWRAARIFEGFSHEEKRLRSRV